MPAAWWRHIARWSLLVVAAACLLVSRQAHASVIVNAPKSLGLTNGLIGWWTFDGKAMAGTPAFDKSGQGNYGTLTNGPERVVGKLGQGMSFDRTDSYVHVGTTGINNNGTYAGLQSLDTMGIESIVGGEILCQSPFGPT